MEVKSSNTRVVETESTSGGNKSTRGAAVPESGCLQAGSRPSAKRLARHQTSPFSAKDIAHLYRRHHGACKPINYAVLQAYV